MSTTESTTRSAHPVRLFWGVFFVAVGFAFVAPTRLDISILLPEVMKGIGITLLSLGGLISTLTVLGTGITEPFMGRLSDILSRRFSLSVGIAVMALFTLLTAVASNVPELLAFRILLGVGQAIYIPAYMAFLGGAFTRRRGFILGGLGGLFSVGSALNPLITGGVYSASGQMWQAPFVVYGIFGVILAGIIFLLGRSAFYEMGRSRKRDFRPEDEARAVDEGKTSIFGRSMILLLITMLCWGLTQYGYLGLFVTYLRTQQHFALEDAEKVASIAGWTAFVFSFLGGWLSDRIGRRYALMAFGVIGLVLSIPVFVLTTSFWSALVIAAIFQAANGMFYPLGIAYGQDMARSHELGGHSGAVSGLGHIMAGLSGGIVGAIVAASGYGAVGLVFLVASAIMVICIFFTTDPMRRVRTATIAMASPGNAPAVEGLIP